MSRIRFQNNKIRAVEKEGGPCGKHDHDMMNIVGEVGDNASFSSCFKQP